MRCWPGAERDQHFNYLPRPSLWYSMVLHIMAPERPLASRTTAVIVVALRKVHTSAKAYSTAHTHETGLLNIPELFPQDP